MNDILKPADYWNALIDKKSTFTIDDCQAFATTMEGYHTGYYTAFYQNESVIYWLNNHTYVGNYFSKDILNAETYSFSNTWQIEGISGTGISLYENNDGNEYSLLTDESKAQIKTFLQESDKELTKEEVGTFLNGHVCSEYKEIGISFYTVLPERLKADPDITAQIMKAIYEQCMVEYKNLREYEAISPYGGMDVNLPPTKTEYFVQKYPQVCNQIGLDVWVGTQERVALAASCLTTKEKIEWLKSVNADLEVVDKKEQLLTTLTKAAKLSQAVEQSVIPAFEQYDFALHDYQEMKEELGNFKKLNSTTLNRIFRAKKLESNVTQWQQLKNEMDICHGILDLAHRNAMEAKNILRHCNEVTAQADKAISQTLEKTDEAEELLEKLYYKNHIDIACAPIENEIGKLEYTKPEYFKEILGHMEKAIRVREEKFEELIATKNILTQALTGENEYDREYQSQQVGYKTFYGGMGGEDLAAHEFQKETGWNMVWGSDNDGLNGDTWIVYRSLQDLPKGFRRVALKYQLPENNVRHMNVESNEEDELETPEM